MKCAALLGLSQTSWRRQDHPKAISYAQNGLEIARDHTYPKLEQELLETLHQSYAALGQHQRAYQYLIQYEQGVDLAKNQKQYQTIGRLKAEHQFRLAEANRTVKEQAEEEAQAKIDQRDRALRWGGTGVLLLILGMTYRGYRIQQKAHRNLTKKSQQIITQKEEIEKQHQEISGQRDSILQQNTLIASALHEKEVLLKEIHHRVKNNLQLIASLLGVYATRHQHPEITQFVREGRSQVRSMALVHQMLYQRDNLLGVDFKEYLTELAELLLQTTAIHYQINGPTTILDVQQAIPLGLIVNEILTNAMKHAFPHQASGTITITLDAEPDHHHLSVADDGVGLPADFNAWQSDSIGFVLITDLIEQIGGEYTLDGKVGVTWSLSFKKSTAFSLSAHPTSLVYENTHC